MLKIGLQFFGPQRAGVGSTRNGRDSESQAALAEEACTTVSSSWPAILWSVSAGPIFIPALTWARADDALFALKDGMSLFDGLGKDPNRSSSLWRSRSKSIYWLY